MKTLFQNGRLSATVYHGTLRVRITHYSRPRFRGANTPHQCWPTVDWTLRNKAVVKLKSQYKSLITRTCTWLWRQLNGSRFVKSLVCQLLWSLRSSMECPPDWGVATHRDIYTEKSLVCFDIVLCSSVCCILFLLLHFDTGWSYPHPLRLFQWHWAIVRLLQQMWTTLNTWMEYGWKLFNP